MATNYTSTDSSSLGGTAGSAGLVQKAYDKFIEFALRDEPLIRSVADKRPVSPTNNGNVVVLQKYADLSNATEVKAFAQHVLNATDQIDILVNNTGTYEPGSTYNEAEGQLEKMLNEGK